MISNKIYKKEPFTEDNSFFLHKNNKQNSQKIKDKQHISKVIAVEDV